MPHPGLVPVRPDRRRVGLALSSVVAVIGLVAAITGGRVGDDSSTGLLVSLYGIAVYTAVGVMILWNRRGHGIGRLALVIGLAFSIGVILDATLTALIVPGSVQRLQVGLIVGVRDVARALADLLPVVAIGLGGILLIAWFPDGRATGRAGQAVHGLLATAVGSLLLVAAQDPIVRQIGWTPTADVVFTVATVIAGVAVLLAFAIAVADLGARYRRSDPVRRAQVRWVFAAAGFSATMTAVMVLTSLGTTIEIPVLWDVWLLSTMLPVLAIGIAISRYHLYDIDRIVSRSISYAVVSALLFSIFAGLTLVLQSLIGGAIARPGTPIDPVVVAASTLVVAALFDPVRVRVQRAVDRRFHRARYDAERTVAGFAGRLRDQLDLPTLTGELRHATSDAVEPSQSAVWLRRAAGSGARDAAAP